MHKLTSIFHIGSRNFQNGENSSKTVSSKLVKNGFMYLKSYSKNSRTNWDCKIV